MATLEATIREPGKKLGGLRKSGQVPAVLYGPKIEPRNLSVVHAALLKAFKEAGESSLITLSLDGQDTMVLIREIQKDPVSNHIIHADFHAVRMDEAIKIKVPIEFTGQSAAVAAGEGVLVKSLHELEIEALPMHLPYELVVDISNLQRVDDAFHVKDVKAPDGVIIVNDPEEIIALLAPVISEEELKAELEAPIEEKVEEVEVVAKEKKEGEEEITAEAPAVAPEAKKEE